MTDNESPPLKINESAKLWPKIDDADQETIAAGGIGDYGCEVFIKGERHPTLLFWDGEHLRWGADGLRVDLRVRPWNFRGPLVLAAPPPVPPPGQQGSELPTEPGVWSRGGTFWVVRRPSMGNSMFAWEVQEQGYMGATTYLKDLPRGGWFPTPPAAAPAASEGENLDLNACRELLVNTTLVGVSRDRVFGEFWKREGRKPVNDAELFSWTIQRAEAAEKSLAASEAARRESERERDEAKANAIKSGEAIFQELELCEVRQKKLKARLSAAQQSAAAMRERIAEVIADIDSHYSEVELATGETLIGSWREKLAAVSQPENRE